MVLPTRLRAPCLPPAGANRGGVVPGGGAGSGHPSEINRNRRLIRDVDGAWGRTSLQMPAAFPVRQSRPAPGSSSRPPCRYRGELHPPGQAGPGVPLFFSDLTQGKTDNLLTQIYSLRLHPVDCFAHRKLEPLFLSSNQYSNGACQLEAV